MRFNKIIATVAICFLLSVSIFAISFADVAESSWYSESVEDVYQAKLMTGTSDVLFSPSDNITVAEAVTISARAHAAYYGNTINDVASQNWYDKYISYATQNGIISDGQFLSYFGYAKRYEVASMLEKALPSSAFSPIKSIDTIPDVPESFNYYDTLVKLYNAGVLTGSDSYGNFFPERTITRAETAAIVSRVVFPDKRIQENLRKTTTDTSYILADTRQYSGSNTGTESGWLLDNRGGVPKIDSKATTGSLIDISETAGTALIKEFNKTTTGTITLRTNINLTSNSEGAYISYRNDLDEDVFKLAIKDNYWSLLSRDGTYKKLTQAVKSTSYRTVITIDLDNSLCYLYLNDYYSGEYPLIMDNANVINMRYGTDEQGKASFTVSDTEMYANYGAYHSFKLDRAGSVPFGWDVDGAEVYNSYLRIGSSGNASTSFDPVSGVIIFEQEMFIDSNTNTSISLKSAEALVAKINVSSLNINVNGNNIYQTYSGGLWYRLRLELDTETMTITVKVNGRKVGTANFIDRATSVDNLLINNNSTTQTLSVDTIKVYEDVQFDDYVPAPVIPAGQENYVVGINVCSLWREGTHSGWATISPYERPILGYYDEGNPESADWEIKYMAEHGIDFQAFCWYGEKNSGYLKNPAYSSQLHDGYMNAKYSDSMKYCLIWECANSYLPSSMDAFKNYFVPYLIENYFKDDRYMTIENKPVFSLFGATRLAEPSFLGSYQNAKSALDYLREQVCALGYDGMIILGCGLSPSIAQSMGIDGIHPYSFGTDGYSLQYNKQRNFLLANSTPYNIPSISVGFNSVAWGEDRTPLMTPQDFRSGVLWVRDTYMQRYSTSSWNKNLTILSTWNEYGEGTYIMPSENNGGFGYLDGVREAFTSEPASNSVNVVPTESQLQRITRLYPQYRRVLQDTNYSEFEYNMNKYEVAVSWNFKTPLTSYSNHSSFTADANGIHGVANNGADPYFFLNSPGNINLDNIASIKVNAKIPSGNNLQIFFTTQSDTTVTESKSISVKSTSNDWQELVLTPTNSNWTGTLVSFRVDPVNSALASYSIKTISLLNSANEVVYTYDCTKLYAPNVTIPSYSFYGYGKNETGIYGYTRTDSACITIDTTLDLTGFDAIRLNARGGEGSPFALYFKPQNQSYTEDFAVSCIMTSLIPEEYILPLKSTMNGTITQLRIYPAFIKHQYFILESIEFLRIKEPPVSISHFNINGNEFDIKTNNEFLANGTVLSAFDPTVALDYRLNAMHLWDKENGVFKLLFEDDELIYTVGSSSYYHNGTKKSLGYTLQLNDGLPMISLKQICDDVGYTYSMSSNGTTVIETPQKAYFDEINNPTPGVWEFNTPGHTGGWVSTMPISVGAEGSLVLHSTHTDPVMGYVFETPLAASNYTTLKIRMKHSTQKANNALRLYFETDVNPGLSESKAFGFNLIGGKVSNGYVVYTIPLTNSYWNGNITYIRFDPFDDIGTAEIDYIRFQ